MKKIIVMVMVMVMVFVIIMTINILWAPHDNGHYHTVKGNIEFVGSRLDTDTGVTRHLYKSRCTECEQQVYYALDVAADNSTQLLFVG